MTRTITQAVFEKQYEQQREHSSRRNFVYLLAVYFAYTVGALVFFLITAAGDIWTNHTEVVWIRVGAFGAAMLVLLLFMATPSRWLGTSQAVATTTTIMVTIVGALIIGTRWPLQDVLTNYVAFGVFDLLVLHVVACAILPLQAKEAIAPLVLLVVAYSIAVIVPVTHADPVFKAVTVILAFGIMAPGTLLAWWKDKQFEGEINRELLGRKVRSMGGELSRARIVHDAMFPNEFDLGHVRFNYTYEPMQEIGGDFVHMHVDKDTGRLYLTLLDVAGHGLAAALTVNRLFGELERVRAENPNAEPEEVIELLNRYIYLTMANYSLFATGACIMLDASTGQVKWVNAGHPPAFIRHGNGTVTELGGTSMLMGVEMSEEFEPNQQKTTIEPGDVIIAYTDGAIEARDNHGERFGIEKLRDTISFDTPPRNWTRFIANAVQKHCDGIAEDDVLIAAITLNELRIANLDGRGADTLRREHERQSVGSVR